MNFASKKLKTTKDIWDKKVFAISILASYILAICISITSTFTDAISTL